MRDDSQFCWNCGNKIDLIREDTSIEGSRIIKCRNCGNDVYENAETCPHCGMRLRIVVVKNPGIAAVLSFFIPGLGQIYNGEIIFGIAFFVIDTLLLGVGGSLLRITKIREGLIFIVIAVIFWIFNIYFTHKTAEKINKKQF